MLIKCARTSTDGAGPSQGVARRAAGLGLVPGAADAARGRRARAAGRAHVPDRARQVPRPAGALGGRAARRQGGRLQHDTLHAHTGAPAATLTLPPR